MGKGARERADLAAISDPKNQNSCAAESAYILYILYEPELPTFWFLSFLRCLLVLRDFPLYLTAYNHHQIYKDTGGKMKTY